jgi:hypothetical protein
MYAVGMGIISTYSHSWFWQEHVVSLQPLTPLPLLPLPPLFFRTIEVKGYTFRVLCTDSILCYGYEGSHLLSSLLGAGKSIWFLTAPAITAIAALPCLSLTTRVKGYIFKVLCTDSILCYGYEGSHLLFSIHGAGKSMWLLTASAITAIAALPCLSLTTGVWGFTGASALI